MRDNGSCVKLWTAISCFSRLSRRWMVLCRFSSALRCSRCYSRVSCGSGLRGSTAWASPRESGREILARAEVFGHPGIPSGHVGSCCGPEFPNIRFRSSPAAWAVPGNSTVKPAALASVSGVGLCDPAPDPVVTQAESRGRARCGEQFVVEPVSARSIEA